VQEVMAKCSNSYPEQLQQLENLLEQEFSMLSARSFENLSEVQNSKTELLLALQKASETDISCTEELMKHKELVEKCRSLQLKNQILVDKKLQAVQGVLDHLVYHGRQTTEHTYENLG
jgi:flagellar biosynthesis/type III secretory pathway chaperone